MANKTYTTGSVDSLNFSLILDDSEFNKKLEADRQAAKQFNTDLSEILSRRVKLESKASVLNERSAQAQAKTALSQEKVRTQTEKTALAAQKVVTEQERTKKIQAQIEQQSKRVADQYRKQSRFVSELGSIAAGYLSVTGLSQFLSSLIRVTGEFQTQQIALRSMLQDADAADSILSRLREFAMVSPYTFQELAKYTKQLAAFGVPISDLYDDVTMLGDAAAGLGVDLSRIILAYGQIKAATVLRGQEMRQLTEAGLPIMEELAKQLSVVEGRMVSVGEVFDMVGKRKVTFEMVRDVFRDLTSEGGKFYNMQENLAQSLSGRISNLKDAFEDMLRTIGGERSGLLNGAVDSARKLVENYRAVGKVLAGLVTTYGAYKAALMAAAAWEKLRALSDNIRLIGMMRKELGLLTATQQAFNISSAANVYVAIGAAVLGVVAALTSFNKKQEDALRTAGQAAQEYEQERKELESLFRIAKDETKSKEDRKKAIDKINDTYGQYLDGLVSEKNSVEDLAGAYEKLTVSLKNKYLEEQRAAMVGGHQTDFNKAQAEMWGMIKKLVDGSGLSAKDQGTIMGRLQSRIGKYGSGWSAMDIYNEIISSISGRGGKMSDKARGRLYEKSFGFKEAQRSLQIAEAEFASFSSGFNSTVRSSAKAASDAADTVITKTTAIEEGIRRTTEKINSLESKAAKVGLTKAELETLRSLREDLKDQSEQYEELTGRKWGKGSKTSTKEFKNFYNGLIRDVETFEESITTARIEAMEDGNAKTLAKIENDHRVREAVIRREYESDLQKAVGDEKAKQDAVRKAQAAFLAEEIRYAGEMDAAERKIYEDREKNRIEFLSKYGTLEQKESAIRDKYKPQIQKAEKEKDSYLVKTLKADMEKEVYELQKSYSGLFALIFADAENLTDFQLGEAIRLTQDEIAKATDSGDIQRLTELYGRLQEQMDVKTSRKTWGFSGLSDAFMLMEAGRQKFGYSTSKEGKEQGLAQQQSALVLMEKSLEEIMSLFSDLGESLGKFGGALGEIGSAFSKIAESSKDIVTAFTSKDKGERISSGIHSVSALLGMMGDQIEKNREATKGWKEAIRQAAHEYAILAIRSDSYEQENIFGVENPYSKAIAGMKRYGTAMAELIKTRDQLLGGKVQDGTRKALNGKNIGTGLGAGGSLGALIGSVIPGIGTIIGGAIGAGVGALAGAATTQAVPKLISLVDKYGEIMDSSTEDPFDLNPRILADYQLLEDETKAIVDNWQEIRSEAESAMEEMHETFTSLVGNLGDDLRDMLVEAWRAGDVYDAIEDMHNYVGEVIEDILERMVFARTLQGVFDDLEKEMDASFAPGGDQDITDDLARFGDRLPARITEFSRGMEAAREAMDRIGYDLWSNVAGEGAGNAISSAGITERTASLLASYVNGIRADVSVQRGLLQEFFAHTVPSLAMYTAEANAHLTNIENSNQAQLERQTEILRELQNQISPGVRRLAGAVATSPSGGNAIRTTK